MYIWVCEWICLCICASPVCITFILFYFIFIFFITIFLLCVLLLLSLAHRPTYFIFVIRQVLISINDKRATITITAAASAAAAATGIISHTRIRTCTKCILILSIFVVNNIWFCVQIFFISLTFYNCLIAPSSLSHSLFLFYHKIALKFSSLTNE